MANHNRSEQLPGEVMARADIRALLRACNRGPTGARNRALLVVLWRGGLRIAEALALRPVDLDAAAGLVRVRRGKSGRKREDGLQRMSGKSKASLGGSLLPSSRRRRARSSRAAAWISPR